ncbi:MAG: SRPBCC family protein [Dehalococcoidia bacterium]
MTDKPRHVYTMEIHGSANQIWDAITKGEMTVQYFHELVESDWAVGSKVAYKNPDGSVVMEGEVLEAERPRRLSYSWHALWDPELAKEPLSRVTWEIEPAGESCQVTLIHDEFPEGSQVYVEVGKGWQEILDKMKALVETGRPEASRAAE